MVQAALGRNCRDHITHRDRGTERRRKVDDPDNLDGVRKEERRGAEAGINQHASQASPFEDLLLFRQNLCHPHDAAGRKQLRSKGGRGVESGITRVLE